MTVNVVTIKYDMTLKCSNIIYYDMLLVISIVPSTLIPQPVRQKTKRETVFNSSSIL